VLQDQHVSTESIKGGLESGDLRDCNPCHATLPGIEYDRPALG
jgi:hypothetical protein